MSKVYTSHKEVRPNPVLWARFKSCKGKIDLTDVPEITDEQARRLKHPSGRRLLSKTQ
jgi:hypothetical protein